MHELSIADSIVRQVADAATRAGARRVTGVRLVIGALTAVSGEALEFAFGIASKDTIVEGARLEVVDVPVTIHCGHCERDVTLDDVQLFACPDCGTPGHVVTTGRELSIESIEVEDEVEASATRDDA